jgi:hypothetical protein
MLLAIEILGILTMITIMFVLIWGFILLTQIFGQLRYKNYLMEKLIQTIYLQKKSETPVEVKEEKEEKQ